MILSHIQVRSCMEEMPNSFSFKWFAAFTGGHSEIGPQVERRFVCRENPSTWLKYGTINGTIVEKRKTYWTPYRSVCSMNGQKKVIWDKK